MLYNVPSRTGVNLEPATVLRLAELPNVDRAERGRTEHEQVGDVVAVRPPISPSTAAARRINLPLLALGGVGIVSVISHLVGPDLQQMHRAFFAGDLETARRLHLRTLPMTKAMFSAPNPCRRRRR